MCWEVTPADWLHPMVIVAEMKRAHIRSWHRAFEAVAQESRYFVRTHAPTLQDLKRAFRDGEERDNPLYAALSGDEVAGWIRVAFPDLPALAHSGTLVMGVLPAYRRQGVGTELLRRALAKGFEREERIRIQLEVYTDNDAAIALYTRSGFQVEGVARQAVRLNGHYKDIVHMALLKSTLGT